MRERINKLLECHNKLKEFASELKLIENISDANKKIENINLFEINLEYFLTSLRDSYDDKSNFYQMFDEYIKELKQVHEKYGKELKIFDVKPYYEIINKEFWKIYKDIRKIEKKENKISASEKENKLEEEAIRIFEAFASVCKLYGFDYFRVMYVEKKVFKGETYHLFMVNPATRNIYGERVAGYLWFPMLMKDDGEIFYINKAVSDFEVIKRKEEDLDGIYTISKRKFIIWMTGFIVISGIGITLHELYLAKVISKLGESLDNIIKFGTDSAKLLEKISRIDKFTREYEKNKRRLLNEVGPQIEYIENLLKNEKKIESVLKELGIQYDDLSLRCNKTFADIFKQVGILREDYPNDPMSIAIKRELLRKRENINEVELIPGMKELSKEIPITDNLYEYEIPTPESGIFKIFYDIQEYMQGIIQKNILHRPQFNTKIYLYNFWRVCNLEKGLLVSIEDIKRELTELMQKPKLEEGDRERFLALVTAWKSYYNKLDLIKILDYKNVHILKIGKDWDTNLQKLAEEIIKLEKEMSKDERMKEAWEERNKNPTDLEHLLPWGMRILIGLFSLFAAKKIVKAHEGITITRRSLLGLPKKPLGR